MDYHADNMDCLQLCVGCPGDFREIKEFLDYGEHSRDWVARVVIRLIENVLPFQKLVRHQLAVAVLKVREYTRHGVVDRVCGPVADIR